MSQLEWDAHEQRRACPEEEKKKEKRKSAKERKEKRERGQEREVHRWSFEREKEKGHGRTLRGRDLAGLWPCSTRATLQKAEVTRRRDSRRDRRQIQEREGERGDGAGKPPTTAIYRVAPSSHLFRRCTVGLFSILVVFFFEMKLILDSGSGGARGGKARPDLSSLLSLAAIEPSREVSLVVHASFWLQSI